MRSSIAIVFILSQFCLVTFLLIFTTIQIRKESVQSVFIYKNAQKAKHFFRSDYRYFKSTKSFYKIHTLAKTWQDAKETCEQEGSSFYYPEDEFESKVVAGYMKNRTTSSSKAFVGASSRLVQGVYETLNGDLVSNLYDNWAPGEPNAGHPRECVAFHHDGTMYDEDCTSRYPFICKKTLASLEWNDQCNMPATGYEYRAATGRCYKFHVDARNWTDAYSICKTEMSYLAVINSELEAEVLVNLTQLRKDDNEKKHMYDQVHVGFHNMFDEGWATVQGVPLSQSGYAGWASGEPNDAMSNEICGSMYYYGKLNDLRCNDLILFFICEHEIERKIDGVYNSEEEFVVNTKRIN